MKAIALAVLLSATQLSAQEKCGKYSEITGFLTDQFGETLQSFGSMFNGSVLFTFANNETGSWSVLIVAPSGVTCVMATGNSYSIEPQGKDT